MLFVARLRRKRDLQSNHYAGASDAGASDARASDAGDGMESYNNPHFQKLRCRLLHRIGRRFRVLTETVEIGPLHFCFTRIADPDTVLDEVAAEADRRDRLYGRQTEDEQLHLPYWAELWDSARGIGHYLVESMGQIHVSDLKFQTVLDLGCGMGMSGTVAAALGANVTFADLEPPALLFARLNSLPWRSRICARRLNWKTDRLVARFNTIIGADILYEREQWPFLDAFWKNHLCDDGSVLLGEPGRQTGDSFLEWISERGWRLGITEVPIPTRPRPIRIFRLERL